MKRNKLKQSVLPSFVASFIASFVAAAALFTGTSILAPTDAHAANIPLGEGCAIRFKVRNNVSGSRLEWSGKCYNGNERRVNYLTLTGGSYGVNKWGKIRTYSWFRNNKQSPYGLWRCKITNARSHANGTRTNTARCTVGNRTATTVITMSGTVDGAADARNIRVKLSHP